VASLDAGSEHAIKHFVAMVFSVDAICSRVPRLNGSGLPNGSRENEHSVWCRMIVNFSPNITSKSLKISHPIFGFHQKSLTNHAVGPKLEPTTELA
jgi:hypothetical protein